MQLIHFLKYIHVMRLVCAPLIGEDFRAAMVLLHIADVVGVSTEILITMDVSKNIVLLHRN